MDTLDEGLSSADTARLFMKAVFSYYTGPLYRIIEANPQLQETIPGFLINPESISVYIGKSHIAVEYTGSEVLQTLPTGQSNIAMQVSDFSMEDGNLLEQIIGFSNDATSGMVPPLLDESHPEHDTFQFDLSILEDLVKLDVTAEYPMPSDYKYRHLPRINRFIELWGNSKSTEPQITQFLAQEENHFILAMSLGAVEIHPEKECSWQSEEKQDIRPDFFISKGNRVDIVEFKLPDLDVKNAVVGRVNREAFCSKLSSYVAQTRVYATYFDDPNNRKWVKEKYGLDVYKPRRILVVGRRSDFPLDEWREIVADHRDLEIMTFDDLIDGVVAQFYRK